MQESYRKAIKIRFQNNDSDVSGSRYRRYPSSGYQTDTPIDSHHGGDSSVTLPLHLGAWGVRLLPVMKGFPVNK